MEIIEKTGRDDIAIVYIAKTKSGRLIEFAESLQPPLPREEKWVLTISTLYGCPVCCRFCDAGGFYQGRLSSDEIVSQISYLVDKRFPDGNIPVKKFKIQFARMGEPSFNESVLHVLQCLPELYDAPGLIPSFSTVAPQGRENFFERLLEIKREKYQGRFQFQFSLHTTDEKLRDWLIPIKKWDFEKMAEYGKAFYDDGDRKITLNFALAEGLPVEPDKLLQYFTPDVFLIKLTPVNPTCRSAENKITSLYPSSEWYSTIDKLQSAGYEVIPAIGALEENHIGSNCGQYISTYRKQHSHISGGYTYQPHKI